MLKCLIVLAWAVVTVMVLDINSPAAAQCAEGAIKGKCISPGLARAMRENARINAQPKASITAAPAPVAADHANSPLRNTFEINQGVYGHPCRQTALGPSC